MAQKKYTKKLSDYVWLEAQCSYLYENDMEVNIFGTDLLNLVPREGSSNALPTLTQIESIRLSDTILKNKRDILTSWLKCKDMRIFYDEFNISSNEVAMYIQYFWSEKIIGYIIDELRGEHIPNKDYIYISTKFLSFIKGKNLWIEHLLKIIILLRNSIISDSLASDHRAMHRISEIFDTISTGVSKNYNHTIIKLLNEYKNAIDNSNIISKTDIYGTIISVNDEFCRLSWYTEKELIWVSHNIVRHPDTQKETFKDIWDTIQSKKIWKWTIKNISKSRQAYWVKSTIIPILDENDQILEYISIRTDVTELKEAYKNLEEYTEALNDTNMVLKLDRYGKIISVNDMYLKMSGYAEGDFLWNHYISWLIWPEKSYTEDNLVPLVQKNEVREIRNCMEHRTTWKWFIKNKTKIGNFFWTSTSIVPIMNLREEILEYVVIQIDVTDLEIAQQNLKISLSKQKELDVKKDEFLNIASHELRTPMTSIKWYISMILEWDAGEINSEVKTYLAQVYKSSQRLLDLINDMLDISKIESGKQELVIEPTEIWSIIAEITKEVSTLFAEKEQNFIVPEASEEFTFLTDGNKLKQILFNLLWNANKFTPKWWTIQLSYQKLENQVMIIIEDTGIGIEKNDFGKIFEKFWQVKNSLTRDIGGTGLWLPIVRAIVEQMHGHIDVKSDVWKGSKFVICLPLK